MEGAHSVAPRANGYRRFTFRKLPNPADAVKNHGGQIAFPEAENKHPSAISSDIQIHLIDDMRHFLPITFDTPPNGHHSPLTEYIEK